VRQGEVASKGAWAGNPQGGVKAPAPLLLPDPATRFARTAARLESLAHLHPMADWLRFMARLAQAQHAAAIMPPPTETPDQARVDQAVTARMPPLAADDHARTKAWRNGLATLLDRLAQNPMPATASSVIAQLRARDENAVEALADNFLHGGLGVADAGAAMYVAAALQVYFTRLAASLHAPGLRLLPQRGLCPCCGSTPVAGVITASGPAPGTRYLYCSLCGTAWNHVRAVCITCGGSRSVSLEGIEGDTGAARAETCNECHTYAKMLYQAKDMQVDPFADDLATLALDVLVGEAGWSRHAANPLVLVGT
jgi:FdhE protein